jgi:hypothetical protein
MEFQLFDAIKIKYTALLEFLLRAKGHVCKTLEVHTCAELLTYCLNPYQPPRLQNTQELALLFICWVTLAYTAVRRKVSAVC